MQKKINVTELKLGMFIHDICGSWMEHPFWKKKFLLDSVDNLKILQECGIQEVWIDTDKGLDVGSEAEPEKVEVAETPAEAPEPQERKRKAVPRVSFSEETARAQKVNSLAKRTVFAMYQDARAGKTIDIPSAIALVDEMAGSLSRNSGVLMSMARIRTLNNYIYVHAVAMSVLMTALGRQMGIEGVALRSLGVAGLLMDIGMMTLPDEVLNKPGALSEEELNLVRAHPQRGWEILKNSPGVDETMLDVCLHHHERVDGAGYPEKLSGAAISQAARIAAVCDVFDAITSDRYHRKALLPAVAIRKMAELRNTHIDEAVFHAFVKTVGIYPVGSLLKLKSGRLGVVLEQSDKSLLMPLVKVFFSVKGNEQVYPELVDLSKSRDAIVSAENPADWKFDLNKIAGI